MNYATIRIMGPMGDLALALQCHALGVVNFGEPPGWYLDFSRFLVRYFDIFWSLFMIIFCKVFNIICIWLIMIVSCVYIYIYTYCISYDELCLKFGSSMVFHCFDRETGRHPRKPVGRRRGNRKKCWQFCLSRRRSIWAKLWRSQNPKTRSTYDDQTN